MRNSSDSTSAVVRSLFETLRGEKTEHSIVIPMLLIALRSANRQELSTSGHRGLLNHLHKLALIAVKAGEKSPKIDLSLPFADALQTIRVYCQAARDSSLDDLLGDVIDNVDTDEAASLRGNSGFRVGQDGSILAPLIQQLCIKLAEHLSALSLASVDRLLKAIAEIPAELSPESTVFYNAAFTTHLQALDKRGNCQFPEEVLKFMLSCLEEAYDQPWDERNLLIPNLDNTLAILPHLGDYQTIAYNHSEQAEWLTTLATLDDNSDILYHRDTTGFLTSDMEEFNPFAETGLGHELVDHVIATPPFGMRLDKNATGARTRHVDSEWVYKICDTLAYNGTAVIAVPTTFLVSELPDYKKLREHLVEASLLEKVILLSQRLVDESSAPLALIVLKKSITPKSIFTIIDGSEAYSAHSNQYRRVFDESKIDPNEEGESTTLANVTKKAIRKNDYSLQPGRYLKEANKPLNVALDDLNETLWRAAELLRGSIPADRYMHTILRLIFLKYLSASLEPELGSRETLTNEYPKLVPRLIEETSPSHDQQGLYLPASAYWSSLRVSSEKALAHRLDDAFNAIEQANTHIKGIGGPAFFSQLPLSQVQLTGLISLIDQISEEGSELNTSAFYGRVFNHTLERFAQFEGHHSGEHNSPQSIRSLIFELLRPLDGKIYDPAMGSGGLLTESVRSTPQGEAGHANLTFYGQDINSEARLLAIMNMAIQGVDFNVGNTAADSFTNDLHPDLHADYAICQPPFGLKNWQDIYQADDPRWKYGQPPKSNADVAWLLHMLHHLAPSGSMACVLPNGTLFRGGSEGLIRKNLIEADLIECIISLPSSLYANTAIPTSLWILTKDKTAFGEKRNREGEVLFIDAGKLGVIDKHRTRTLSHDELQRIANSFHHWQTVSNGSIDLNFSASIDLNQIAANDFQLQPWTYIHKTKLEVPQGHILKTLGELLSALPPETIQHGSSGHKIRPADVCSASGLEPVTFSHLESTTSQETDSRQKLKLVNQDCILISKVLRGSDLGVCWYKQQELPLLLPQQIKAYGFDPSEVDPRWLQISFQSENTRKQVELLSRSAVQPILLLKQLDEIQIVVPPLEEQARIVATTQETLLASLIKEQGLEDAIAQNEERFWNDLSLKEHRLSTMLNNLQAGINTYRKALQAYGQLSPDTVINPYTEATALSGLHNLYEQTLHLGKQVKLLSERETYAKALPIDLSPTLQSYIDSHGDSHVNFEIDSDLDSYLSEMESEEGNDPSPPQIQIGQSDLEKILDNVVANALRHGLTESGNTLTIRFSVSFLTTPQCVVLEVSNNGKPMPKGMTKERYLTRGEIAGKSGNTGLGGYQNMQIMKHVGGNLDLALNHNSTFPVTISFTFPAHD